MERRVVAVHSIKYKSFSVALFASVISSSLITVPALAQSKQISNSELRSIVMQQQKQIAMQQAEIKQLSSKVNKLVEAQQPKSVKQKSMRPTAQPTIHKENSSGTLAPQTMGKIDKYLKTKFPFKVGGRLMYDYANYSNTTTRMGSGTKLRRARVGITGNVTPNWGYALSVDFAGNAVSVKDAYIQYLGFKPIKLTIGQYKEPFSLEESTSSKYSTFIERALPNALVPSRNIGIGASTYGDFSESNKYTAALGVFSEPVGTSIAQYDEGHAVTARLTDTIMTDKAKVFTFGVSGSYKKPNADGIVSYDSKPESEVTSIDLVDTGDIQYVNTQWQYGLQAAGVYNSFSVQGEYMKNYLKRNEGNSNLNFDGWYGYVSWFATGEYRPFNPKTATFGGIKPLHSYGAWELAARVSNINLNSGNVNGGKETDYTLGLNWYANAYVRFMANFVKGYADTNGVTNNPNIVELRAQVNF